MRKKSSSSKMWYWVVPCKSKSRLRRESRMEIEEILKMKLETIHEEPETENGPMAKHSSFSKKVKRVGFKDSYVVFMTGFAARGGLGGLPRY
ncbi:Unknown protein [Striga hermonthica]|uniref:Uncharacterized protein n=1 Tax=Striga hermonthica TaxID=68872 RepID=A0A9N7MMZ6_STRHE|nr:Unknown protein [Striga hermonthica]